MLISESGFNSKEEIYARGLIFEQIGASDGNNTTKQLLLAYAAHAYHLLDDVFNWADIKYPNAKWINRSEEANDFVELLNSAGKFKDFADMAGRREFPHWWYAKSHRGRVSVVIFTDERMLSLRHALFPYKPVSLESRSRISILAGGLKNAIPKKILSTGLKYIRAIEEKDQIPWCGANSTPSDLAIVAIPLESHCVFLGKKTLVAVENDCGIRQFEAERTKFLERRSKENIFFAADYIFHWPQKIDGAKFEDLIYALLEREPGVKWIRQASPTNERDGGMDFIASWVVPSGEGLANHSPIESEISAPAKAIKVVVQVKALNPSVGKSKVLDIRDTAERHEANGYFLVAFPQPANSLVVHLTTLAKHGIWTNWWDRAQIETRLRKHMDLIARFADLVKIEMRDI